MIKYNGSALSYVFKIFQLQGSVFPGSLMASIPAGLIAALFHVLAGAGFMPIMKGEYSIIKETQAWSGFSFMVGFLIVFRTSQAYNRFWAGCTAAHQMRAVWFDAASALAAFAQHSKGGVESELVIEFRHAVVRLFSMLHAACLSELEEMNEQSSHDRTAENFRFELIDPTSLDKESLSALKASNSRVELLLVWLQCLLVENMKKGVLDIPAPMLARAHHLLSEGMVAFHNAVKVVYIPFPFPYAQTCDCILVLHWLIVPFVTCHWVTSPAWAAILVFVQVFVLWSLNFIALEIENPFGTDDNDLDGSNMQIEFNRLLVLLLRAESVRVPRVLLHEEWLQESIPFDSERYRSMSLQEMFVMVDDKDAANTSRKEHDFTRTKGKVSLHSRASTSETGGVIAPRSSVLSGVSNRSSAAWRRMGSSSSGVDRCSHILSEHNAMSRSSETDMELPAGEYRPSLDNIVCIHEHPEHGSAGDAGLNPSRSFDVRNARLEETRSTLLNTLGVPHQILSPASQPTLLPLSEGTQEEQQASHRSSTTSSWSHGQEGTDSDKFPEVPSPTRSEVWSPTGSKHGKVEPTREQEPAPPRPSPSTACPAPSPTLCPAQHAHFNAPPGSSPLAGGRSCLT